MPLPASSRQHPGSGDSTRRGRGSALRSTLARMCCAVLCCAGACTIYNAIRASDGSARIYGSWRILPSGAREERNEKKKRKKKKKKKKTKKRRRRKKKKRDRARSMQGLYSHGMSYTPPAVSIHYLSFDFSLFLLGARSMDGPRNSPVSAATVRLRPFFFHSP